MAATMTQSPPFMSPNPTVHNKHQEDDHLDTLSLRDLPITAVDPSPSPAQHRQSDHSRRSSSDPTTSDFFFEFLVNNDDDSTTSSAEDVIFHGRLLPFAPPPQPHPRRSFSLSSRFTRRQLNESYSESPPSTIRPSKSLNYRKLHRNHRSNSKPKSEPLHRNSCNNNSNNNNTEKLIAPAKSPWNWLIFGLPKVPAEMELKDIKNRQYRRNLSTSKSSNSGDNKSCSASWRFLSVLSCKSHATVDVNNTAPFRNFLM